MTYNVFGGTLNPSQSVNQLPISDCRCIKGAKYETSRVRQRLQRALLETIDDIIGRIYAARPSLPPMVADDSAATTVKAIELIDLCYRVSLT